MVDPQPAQLARHRSRRSRSSSAKRSRTRRRTVSTSTSRAGLGVDERRGARRRAARCSRGIARSRRQHGVAERAARRAGAPSRRWSRKSEITTTRPGWPGQPADAARARRRAPSESWWPSAATPVGQQPAQRDDRPAASPRRQHARLDRRRSVTTPTLPARRTPRRPNTSAAPSATSAFSRSAVPNAIDGETSSTIQVRQRPLGDVQADVRLAGARGGRGVDVADVVAGLVRAAAARARCPGPTPGRAAVARAGSAPTSRLTGRGRARRSAAAASGPGPGGGRRASSVGGSRALVSPRSRGRATGADRSRPALGLGGTAPPTGSARGARRRSARR